MASVFHLTHQLDKLRIFYVLHIGTNEIVLRRFVDPCQKIAIPLESVVILVLPRKVVNVHIYIHIHPYTYTYRHTLQKKIEALAVVE